MDKDQKRAIDRWREGDRNAFSKVSLRGMEFVDMDLSGIELTGRTLNGVKFLGCNLSNANFSNSSLYGSVEFDNVIASDAIFRRSAISARFIDSSFTQADFSLSEFRYSQSRGSLYYCANFHYAYFRRSVFTRGSMHGVNFTSATFYGYELFSGVRGIFSFDAGASGNAVMVPMPNGTWRLYVGCWSGTPAELRTLIAGDSWPSGCNKAERDRRRPILSAIADLAEAQGEYHEYLLDSVVRKWGSK